MKEWLLERWSRKDALLETFRREGHFPGQVSVCLPFRPALHPSVPPYKIAVATQNAYFARQQLLLAIYCWCCIDYGGDDCAQASSLPGSLVRSVWTLSYCTAFVVLVASGWWRLLRRLLLLSRGRLLTR